MNCRWLQNNRIIVPALLASAALNIVFIGYCAGHSFFKRNPSHEHVMNARVEGLTTLLPQASRDEIETVLNKQNGAVKKKYRAMNAERHRIQKIIEARDVNVDDLHAAFDHLRQLHADSQKIYQDAFTDAVVKLPYPERRRINRRIKERHPLNEAAEEANDARAADEAAAGGQVPALPEAAPTASVHGSQVPGDKK